MANNYLDILEFIQNNNRFFDAQNNVLRVLLWYKLVYQTLRAEKVPIYKIWFFIFQGLLASQFLTYWKWWPKCLTIKRSKVDNHCSKKFLEHIFQDKPINPVLLFNKPFFYLPEKDTPWGFKYYSFYDLVYLIQSIIIKDQYYAKQLIRDNDTIIDAGALIGDFSCYVNYLYPKAKIYAFEPSPMVFKLLKQNTEIRTNNIFCFNQALSNKNGEAELNVSKDITLWGGDNLKESKIRKQKDQNHLKQEHITTITIDSFVQQNKLVNVNFIKIDTEGFEKEILEGAVQTIRNFSPTIVCSAYHIQNDDVNIPKLVLSINPKYKYHLAKSPEKDLIFQIS